MRVALDAELRGGSFTGAPDIVALGNTGNPRAVPILAQALRSNERSAWSWNAPRAAAYALGNIRSKQSADVLLSWLQERNRTLKVDCDDQCVLVIKSLAKLREKRAVPVLISLLRPLEASSTHTTHIGAWARVSWDDYVRKAAANAIAEIGGEGALPALEKASRDPDLALGSSAKDALKKLRAK